MLMGKIALKVVIAGEAKAGKSKLVGRLKDGQYSEGYEETIGVDFFRFEQTDPMLDFWDLTGNARYEVINESYYPQADAIIIVVDLSNPKAIAEQVERAFKNAGKFAPNAKIYLVGTKADKATGPQKTLFQQYENSEKVIAGKAVVSSKTGEGFDKINGAFFKNVLGDLLNSIKQVQQPQQESQPSADALAAAKRAYLLLRPQSYLGQFRLFRGAAANRIINTTDINAFQQAIARNATAHLEKNAQASSASIRYMQIHNTVEWKNFGFQKTLPTPKRSLTTRIKSNISKILSLS